MFPKSQKIKKNQFFYAAFNIFNSLILLNLLYIIYFNLFIYLKTIKLILSIFFYPSGLNPLNRTHTNTHPPTRRADKCGFLPCDLRQRPQPRGIENRAGHKFASHYRRGFIKPPSGNSFLLFRLSLLRD